MDSAADTSAEASASLAERHQVTIGQHTLDTWTLGPQRAPNQPLVMALHGSGPPDLHLRSWASLLQQLVAADIPTFFYERTSQAQSSLDATNELILFLEKLSLGPPYLIVAHSYGGCIARDFLQIRHKQVIGMALVETGQETGSQFEKTQNRKQVLGSKLLSVIRANSLIGKLKAFQAMVEEGKVSADQTQVQRDMLEQWDREDEMLKKAQLRLSKNTRYVHLPDCGHHVIRDRPEAVVEEIRWVLEQHNKRPSQVEWWRKPFKLLWKDGL